MSVTKVVDIAYVRIASDDLEATQTFNERFGLHVERGTDGEGRNVLYSRGTNGSPYHHVTVEGEKGFLAVAFEAETRNDLELLAQQPGASAIASIEAPGGGEKVSFTDPNGYTVEIVHGRAAREKIGTVGRPPLNTAGEVNRLREPVRLQQEHSQVKRLGHCVLFVKDYRESAAWYQELFGFLKTDEIHAGPPENVIGAFVRCDRGGTPVDHHTLALLQPPNPDLIGMQHAAFEVYDWDDLMVGHYALANSGYKSDWGVGKHILGSQIFDYWFDPNGQVMEHFTDGDLFDASQPPNLAPIEALLGAQWGPPRMLEAPPA